MVKYSVFKKNSLKLTKTILESFDKTFCKLPTPPRNLIDKGYFKAISSKLKKNFVKNFKKVYEVKVFDLVFSSMTNTGDLK